MDAVARVGEHAVAQPRLHVLCALPRTGALGNVAALVARFGNGTADILFEHSARGCRALLDGGGCDVVVVADDPLGQHILGDPMYRSTPVVVIARNPSRAAQRATVRDEFLERGAFLCIFAIDATFPVIETALEAARSHLVRIGVGTASGTEVHRGALMRYLDMVLAQPLPADFSLVVAEIRSFELLHQTHGPASCGELVRRVAGRLALGVDAPDVVAYLGAGRFGWLTEQGNAEDLQRRLLQCVELPVKIDEEPVYISAKIGVVHGPRAFASAEDVVRDGIIAAQQARSAEDASNVFESDMRLQPLEDLRLELSLRQAVAENAFRLEYQPIVDLGTGALVGFESLVRWTTADGPVSPARFIPVAERTGLIAPIGRWVLATAAMQAARWNVSRSRPVLVSVNVSAHQITPALVDDLRTLLAHTGLHPSLLKLEFTETAIADDPRVVGVLDECRALGVQVWIDDFGTGFSSLAYLQRFPISGLKVDKCFVDPLDGTPQSASMAKAILYIADAIGVETVAEGIETEAQRQQLRELGYRWGQGYLFSRPLRVDAAEELLSRSD